MKSITRISNYNDTISNPKYNGAVKTYRKTINELDNINPTKKILADDYLIFKNHDDISILKTNQIPDVPKIKLLSGTITNDYSNDHYFADRMKTMSLEEAEHIKLLVNKYPEEYPMPCMAITATAIKKSIVDICKQFNLTSEEQKIFNELEIDLKQLFPLYPYKKSLTIAYKWALFKSFLEYKFQLDDYQPPLKYRQDTKTFENINTDTIGKHDLLFFKITTHFSEYLGIHRLSIFKDNCSIDKINNLPWDKLLEDTEDFKKSLLNIYFSGVYYRVSPQDSASAFEALCSKDVLIPYTQELSIEFFNNTWPLPLWLVGYAVDVELINADNYNMSTSSFFEHDLFHLAVKLKQLQNKKIIFNKLLTISRLIYKYQYLLSKIDFKHIEVVLFFITHEKGILFADNASDYFCGKAHTSIITAIDQTFEAADIVSLSGLPCKYKNTNVNDMQKACCFLKQLFIYTNSEYQIMQKLAYGIDYNYDSKLKSDINDNSVIIKNRYITIDPGGCEYIDQIIKFLKYNKNIFIEYNINPSRIIAILRLYYNRLIILYNENKISIETLKQDKIDENILSSISINFIPEKQVILYLLKNNFSLSSANNWKLAYSEIAKKEADHKKILTMLRAKNKNQQLQEEFLKSVNNFV
jgi:hypothetical protein